MRRVIVVLLVLVLVFPASRALAEAGALCSTGTHAPVECVRPAHYVHDVCQAIDTFSRVNGLDPGFFARLLWQESRFDPNALSHANAQGIAQFIPSTAALRGLKDPWNPAEAMEFSAHYLGELTRRYGNQGLAAVAYNGGEGRANGLVARTGGLARETVNYVRIITGLPAETWRDYPPETHSYALQPDLPFRRACHELGRNRRLSAFPEPEPTMSPWGVQMAFGTTRDRALAQYRDRRRRCTAQTRGEDPELIWQKARSSPRGGYFMVRLGRPNRDSAWKLCRTIKAAGCLCAVYRNR